MRRLVPWLVVGGLLTLPLFAAPAFDDEVPPKDDPLPKTISVGDEVPAKVAMTSIDGEPISFKELRGKVVVLHFWSDRCPAERHANPIFGRLENQFDAEKVVMIGVASNQNELGGKPAEGDDYADFYQALRKKWTEVKFQHSLYADHGNRVSDLFQAKTTPHCFVIDPKGVLRDDGALDDDPRGQKGDEATNYVKQTVDALLKGERPPVTSTKPYG